VKSLGAFWKLLSGSLLSNKGRELGVFLFFFAISAGFWLLQTLDETFEYDLAIPLQLENVPEDVIVTTPLPESVHVVLRDKGAVLLRYWNLRKDTVHLSFDDYENGGKNGRVRVPQADVIKMVQSHLHNTTKVQTLRPDTLEYYFNHGLHSTVPIRIIGDVETSPRYYLLDVQTNPSEVKVFAPAATLDTLTAVCTKPVSLTKLEENTTIDVPLTPIRGAMIEPDKVKLTATVDVYMENSVEVPVISLNFPGDKQLRTFPSTVKVTYTVGYARSKDVKRSSFVSIVTYEEILELQEQGATKIPIRLKTIPEGISNVRIEPQEVDYLVENVSED